jgi:hypothetical protein
MNEQRMMQDMTKFFFCVPICFISNSLWWVFAACLSKSGKPDLVCSQPVGFEHLYELRVFDFSKEHKILHVERRVYPLRTIKPADHSHAGVSGIGKNEKPVHEAQQVTQQMLHPEGIMIMQGDGTRYHVEPFNAIIASSCLMLKVPILEYVFTTTKENLIIIMRELSIFTCVILSCINARNNINQTGKKHHQSLSLLLLVACDGFYLRETGAVAS